MVLVAFWGTGETEGHECGLPMTIAMAVLAIGTLGGGGFSVWTAHIGEHAGGHGSAHTIVLTASILASVGGVLLAFVIYQLRWISPANLATGWASFHDMLRNQYHVDEIYETAIVNPLTATSTFCWRIVDDLLIDGLIRLGGITVEIGGLILRFTQTGYIRHYLLYLSGGIAVILTLLLWGV